MSKSTPLVGLSATQRKSIGAGVYTGPRVRGEHEALPPQVDKLAGKYAPPVWGVRPGADDHLSVKSVGV